jgi:DegV family protein with EDD domain
MKVAFVTDTGTGRHPEEWDKKGIYCLPLQITCDGESKDEYTQITYDEVIQKLHEKKVLKTSLPSLGKIQDCFEELKKEGYDTVFAVPICRGLSGTLDSMEMIANQLEMKFVGVDCYCTAVEEGYMIETAKTMYEDGKPLNEIVAKLQEVADSCETVLLCDDLDHMKRGGRLTPMAAALGGLLKIKPILHIGKTTNGKVDVLDKVRTMSRAQDRVIKHLKELGMDDSYTYIVAHVDALEGAKQYANRIEEQIEGSKVKVIDLVSAVGIHTGLGCLALQVFKE